MTNASKPTCRRLPLLGALAWCGAVFGLALATIAAAWHDGLGRASETLLLANYVAFMCRTFVFHAGVAMLPVLAISLPTKRHRLSMVAAVVFLLGTGPELLSLRPRAREDDGRASLKLMSVNLMYGHGDADALLAQIARESPDVIVFQEWTPDGAVRLRAALAAGYPHSVEEPRDDAFGQAVFSRRAFVGATRTYPPLDGFHEPQICVSVDLGGRVLRLTDVHLLPPVSMAYFREQRLGAFTLRNWQADPSRDDKPDILVGDFNATTRSAIVSAILGTGMMDAQAEAGWWRGTTWPRVGMMAYAPGLQLDHALVGPRLECVEARVGEDFGSDHRPVIVQVRWR